MRPPLPVCAPSGDWVDLTQWNAGLAGPNAALEQLPEVVRASPCPQHGTTGYIA
jgi:hypothetical protein